MQSMTCAEKSAKARQSSGSSVVSMDDGSVTLHGPTDRDNIRSLLSASRGVVVSLMLTLESTESLMTVDALEEPRRLVAQLDCLIGSAILDMGGVA